MSGYTLEVPPKLLFLFTMFGLAEKDLTEGFDHIIIEGGRGGGKSESVASLLVLVARSVRIRIVCAREVQKSLSDSVKHIIEKWIIKMGLRHEFHITKNQIISKRTGTDFIFIGMKAAIDNNTLKSLDEAALVWFEEAACTSYRTLEILDPTIRTPYRKLIYTQNPEYTTDAIPVFFKGKKKVKFVTINYQDNPFLPQSLLDQALEMKELDYERYLHVWQGHPIPEDTSLIILPYTWLSQCIDLHKKVKDNAITDEMLENDFKVYGGFDIADGTTDMHDKNSLAVRKGPVITHVEEWQIDEAYKSVAHINRKFVDLGFNVLHFDATAIGTAAKSEFSRLENQAPGTIKYDVYPFKGGMAPLGKDVPYVRQGRHTITNGATFSNRKAQQWWNLRLRLENSMRLLKGEKIDKDDYYLSFSSNIPNLERIFKELSQATFEEDSSGRIKVDKQPGVRSVLIDGKEKDRESPNMADSIGYAYASDLDRGLQAFVPKSRKVEVI